MSVLPGYRRSGLGRSSSPRIRRPDPRQAAMERRFRAAERRHYWAAALVAAALCGICLFHTWTRVAVLERSRVLGEAKREGERLASELHSLKVEKATLEGVRRVDSEARTRLGMAPPSPDRLIILETLAPERVSPPVIDPERVEANAQLPARSRFGVTR